MSIEVNYEEVAKQLALEIADLKFQLASFKNVAISMEQELRRRDEAAQSDASNVNEEGMTYEQAPTV